jgi:hypothetical protein
VGRPSDDRDGRRAKALPTCRQSAPSRWKRASRPRREQVLKRRHGEEYRVRVNELLGTSPAVRPSWPQFRPQLPSRPRRMQRAGLADWPICRSFLGAGQTPDPLPIFQTPPRCTRTQKNSEMQRLPRADEGTRTPDPLLTMQTPGAAVRSPDFRFLTGVALSRALRPGRPIKLDTRRIPGVSAPITDLGATPAPRELAAIEH